VKRSAATIVVTALCTAYIVWKIDLRETWEVLAHARVGWWLASLGIMVVSVWPMAWRWQLLLGHAAYRSRQQAVPSSRRHAAGRCPASLGSDASLTYETRAAIPARGPRPGRWPSGALGRRNARVAIKFRARRR
jgi:hypothetical protein